MNDLNVLLVLIGIVAALAWSVGRRSGRRHIEVEVKVDDGDGYYATGETNQWSGGLSGGMLLIGLVGVLVIIFLKSLG